LAADNEPDAALYPSEIPMRTKNLVRFAFGTVFLLLIPLVAKQFSDEWAWGPDDFIIAGVLLFGTGLAYEFVAGKSGNARYRAASGLAAVSGLLLIWINGAVGLIGSEDNPANLLYGAVLATGFLGAILARLEAHGMSLVMFAMALTQVAATAIGLAIGGPDMTAEGSRLVNVLGINAIFVMLFLGSGMLFRLAAGAQPATR
jgi:hypothetical protein